MRTAVCFFQGFISLEQQADREELRPREELGPPVKTVFVQDMG